MKNLSTTVLFAIVAAVGTSASAFAMDPAMMKPGETMMMMPDGQMGSMMVTDQMMTDEMMKMAKPMDTCMMMMMGKDGKMYMMEDMKMPDGKMACESMMMKK